MSGLRLRFVAAINPPAPGWEIISDNELLTFVPLDAVWPDRVDYSQRRPKSEVASGYTRFCEGDVVVPKITPTFEADRSTLIQGMPTIVCTGTTELHVIRPGDRVNARYIHYLVSSRPFLLGGEAEMVGVAGQKRVPDSWLRNCLVPVQDPVDQRAIADFLDRETTRIDALITAKRRMIELLEARWRVAIVGRMTELLTERGAAPLKRMVECLDGLRVPLNREERSGKQGPFPYFGASGVVDHVDEYLFDEDLVLLGEDGAQLADPSYEIAFVVRGKCWVNNHAHVLRPIDADAEFLAMHLMTLDRASFISGATREKITQDDMVMIPIPRLTKGEQQCEAIVLANIRDDDRRLSAIISTQINLLVERRQAVITAAVTGELGVGVAA